MAVVVNNSERAITIIDVLVAPGMPTELQDERLNHPGVQSLMHQMTERNVPVLVIVATERDNV
jgi:hypothetical protein